MKLFDSKIPILDDQSDPSLFDKLEVDFSKYDPSYVFNAAAKSRREPILSVYEKCKEYLDDDFCKEIREPGKFIDRLWELQVEGTPKLRHLF